MERDGPCSKFHQYLTEGPPHLNQRLTQQFADFIKFDDIEF